MATKVYDLTVSPMSLFNDMTYLGTDEELAKAVRRRCMDDKHIPLIEFDSDLGWVFHTIFPPDGTVSRKVIAERFERNPQVVRQEAEMETILGAQLAAQGHQVRRQAPTAAGVADLVTDKAVYELKLRLSVYATWQAVGQVMIYRQALGGHLQPVIVGGHDPNAERLYEYVRDLGIQIIFWEEE